MFEEIVEKKYKPLKEIADGLTVISSESIKNSDLPLYAINFLISEQAEISDRNLLNSQLEKSVKLIVNYSLRPKWTIINYLFGGFDSKPADEILRKSEVFRFYRYYVDLISNHIKDNALMFITQDDVKYLTDEANKVVLDKLINNTSSIKIKNFFSQIYKLKYGDDKEINLDWSVPFLFIKLFLEDKGFNDLLDKFGIIPGLDDTMEIEMKTAIKVLTDKYYVNDDFFVIKEEPKTLEAEEKKIETGKNVFENFEVKPELKEVIAGQPAAEPVKEEVKPEIKSVKEIIPPETTTEEKPREKEIDDKPKGLIRIIKNIPTKRFQREKKTDELEIKQVAEPKPEEEKQEEGKQEESAVRKRERSGGEEKIKHIFKKEEIIAIQKKVFRGKKSEMYDCFDELEKFTSWQNASGYLKEIFLKNKVSLYNKYSVLFVDLLSEHFSNKERGN